MENLSRLYDAILGGYPNQARSVTGEALADHVDPQVLINEYMIPAMDEMGRRFEACEVYLPDLLVSARAMKAALELIQPLLSARGSEPIGRIVIGTVKGDLHDIGKNLVAVMLEGGGFEVIDLGVDATPEKFIQAIRERNAQVVAMSALLTTTMVGMKTTIDALASAGVRDRVKVIIGGAPITQQYADSIGADGYSNNAIGAVALARRLLGIQR